MRLGEGGVSLNLSNDIDTVGGGKVELAPQSTEDALCMPQGRDIDSDSGNVLRKTGLSSNRSN